MTALLVSLPLAEAPALPLHTAGPYVAAAYMVFLLILLIYVGIMAARLMRSQRDLRDLRARLEERELVAAELDGGDEPPLNRDENENQTHSHVAVGGDPGGVDAQQ